MDHVVVDVEIQKTIEETPGGWGATDKVDGLSTWWRRRPWVALKSVMGRGAKMVPDGSNSARS